MEYSATKRNKVVSSTAWVALGNTVLSERS